MTFENMKTTKSLRKIKSQYVTQFIKKIPQDEANIRLLNAIKGGSIIKMQTALHYGADPNVRNEERAYAIKNAPALLLAMVSTKLSNESLQILIDAGAVLTEEIYLAAKTEINVNNDLSAKGMGVFATTLYRDDVAEISRRAHFICEAYMRSIVEPIVEATIESIDAADLIRKTRSI